MSRPLIAIPARFTASASAIRYRGEVIARALAEAVYDAGGEPISIHPAAPEAPTETEIASRLWFAEGVLLPGGGDVSPDLFGGEPDESIYDVDREQDAFDLAVAAWAVHTNVPMLAICRGMQVLNVAAGGTLITNMPQPHRGVHTSIRMAEGSAIRAIIGSDKISVSCYHHQAVHTLGPGLRATAHGDDGTVEALESDDAGWVLAVQWHPEDTYDRSLHQRKLLAAYVDACRDRQ